jgi:hypothetical protein
MPSIVEDRQVGGAQARWVGDGVKVRGAAGQM